MIKNKLRIFQSQNQKISKASCSYKTSTCVFKFIKKTEKTVLLPKHRQIKTQKEQQLCERINKSCFK